MYFDTIHYVIFLFENISGRFPVTQSRSTTAFFPKSGTPLKSNPADRFPRLVPKSQDPIPNMFNRYSKPNYTADSNSIRSGTKLPTKSYPRPGMNGSGDFKSATPNPNGSGIRIKLQSNLNSPRRQFNQECKPFQPQLKPRQPLIPQKSKEPKSFLLGQNRKVDPTVLEERLKLRAKELQHQKDLEAQVSGIFYNFIK